MHTKQCKNYIRCHYKWMNEWMNKNHAPPSKQSRKADLRCIVLHTSTQCVLIMSEFIRSSCKLVKNLSECEREAPRSRAQGRTGLARAAHTRARARARAPLDGEAFRAVRALKEGRFVCWKLLNDIAWWHHGAKLCHNIKSLIDVFFFFKICL